MNPIKERVIRFLRGDETCPTDVLMSISEQARQELIPMGTDCDADAILLALRVDKKIYLAGVVGRSVIQGPDLLRYVEGYFADSGGMDVHGPRIADYIYNDIKGGAKALMVLKTSENRWRSFRPLKNVDEVMAGAMNS